jgi:hypothetical protein
MSREASTIRAAAAWPDTLWDGGPFTPSYTKLWMNKMAGDLAEQRVPGFAAWRPNGSKEFLDWLRRDQAARREAAQRQEAVARVRQAARTASSRSGKRDWVDKLLRGQSAATSPGMTGVYKEQWNHIRDGYGGLPNMPSW